MRKAIFAAALCAVAAAPAYAQQFINILTGGTSGVYYPLGNALSSIYAKAMPEARVTVQATKASVENLNLIQAGRGEVAFTLGDSLTHAAKGDAEMGFAKPLDKVRTIAAIYPNYIQIVASRESGIRTLADLKGKRVSVGAPKSGTEVNARTVFAAAGLGYDDMSVQYLPFGESVELIKNRQLDATLQSAGLGVASIRDLATSVPITVVEIPEDVAGRIEDPSFIATTIPAGTYDGQSEAVATAAINNFLVTRADLGEDTVYVLTKAMFENLADLKAAHAAAEVIAPETATKGSPVPLHPGAERYYRERGFVK